MAFNEGLMVSIAGRYASTTSTGEISWERINSVSWVADNLISSSAIRVFRKTEKIKVRTKGAIQ
jgi:hypothetical protein